MAEAGEFQDSLVYIFPDQPVLYSGMLLQNWKEERKEDRKGRLERLLNKLNMLLILHIQTTNFRMLLQVGFKNIYPCNNRIKSLHLFTLCIYIFPHTCHGTHMEVRGQLLALVLSFHHVEHRDGNKGCQTWWQVSLSTETSHQSQKNNKNKKPNYIHYMND